MSTAIYRFDVRYVVFSPEDVHAGLKGIEAQLKSADIEVGDSGIVSMKYERAARWIVSEYPDGAGVPNRLASRGPHLEPFMFNLTCAFTDRAFLREALGGVHQFFDAKLGDGMLHPGLSGDVPDFRAGAPCGEWEITYVDLPAPQFYETGEIWRY